MYTTTSDSEAQLLAQLEGGDARSNPFYTCRQLSDYVRQLIEKDARQEMAACFARMLNIYKSTSKCFIKTAIENVFIYGLGANLLSPEKRQKLMTILPEPFCEMLKEQMIGSGI